MKERPAAASVIQKSFSTNYYDREKYDDYLCKQVFRGMDKANGGRNEKELVSNFKSVLRVTGLRNKKNKKNGKDYPQGVNGLF